MCTYMGRFVVNNGHQEDMCFDYIELDMLFNLELHSKINHHQQVEGSMSSHNVRPSRGLTCDISERIKPCT